MEKPRTPEAVALRISVTDRCPLRCRYCMPPEGVPLTSRQDVLRFEEIAEFARLVHRCIGLAKVRLTGGEPLLRPGLTTLVEMLARVGVADLALTTSGQLLAPMAAGLRRAGLRRVNISLDSLDPAGYRGLTRGGDLARTLAGIEAAREAGLAPVKLNTVVLRGINDGEAAEIARYALERGCEARFLELMPIGVAAPAHSQWFVPSAEIRARLAEAFDLEEAPSAPGSSSRNFLARDAAGRSGLVGFISPCTEPFCRSCRRLRLTATGQLLGCLAQEKGMDVRAILRGPRPVDEMQIVGAVEEALRVKRGARHFADQRFMVSIGG